MAEYNSVLSDGLLKGCAERVGKYDRENSFFYEDFEQLKAAGYLTGPIPREFGGSGLSLLQSCQEQRKLAYHAPATALALNMHLYWLGVAADLWRNGDKSMEWVLKDGADGEIFSAGHSEPGNDLPLFLSTTKATRVDGGFQFTGHKMFGSLTPVWTKMGLHGMDTDHPDGPRIIHAFMPRESKGYEIKNTWDVMGMRATSSDDTHLNEVFIPDEYIVNIIPAGQGDPFVLSVFAWALLGFSAIYCGVAKRAIDLVVPMVQGKSSLAMTRPMSYHPEVQHSVAELMLAYETMNPVLETTATEWGAGVDHGLNWPAKIVTTKYHCVETCWKVVDKAMDVSSGHGMFRSNELERLFRDARCGRFHPATSNLVHEIVGKTALGIDLGEQPRWG
jgi:alkylation response protein AidB-like acyl-CoA dehydrogenase